MSAIELDGAFNVRDLGGLASHDGGQTRPGLLYRSDSLDVITEADQDVLFRQLRIGVVIDLRTGPEVHPAAWRESVEYHQFPLISEQKIGKEPFPAGAPEDLGRLYLSNLVDGQEALRATFEVLARHLPEPTPCVIGCAAGRDRTGVVVAVLMSMLGVTDDEIAADYSESNRHAEDVSRRLALNPLYANGQSRPGVAIAAPAAMRAFLRLVRERYGSAADYVLGTGLAPEAISAIRAALIGRSTGETVQPPALVS